MSAQEKTDASDSQTLPVSPLPKERTVEYTTPSKAEIKETVVASTPVKASPEQCTPSKTFRWIHIFEEKCSVQEL